MKTKRVGRVFIATQNDLLTVAATRGAALQQLAEQIFRQHAVKRAHEEKPRTEKAPL